MTRKALLEHLHPDDKDAAHAAIERAISEAGMYDIEYRVVWPDGTIHWLAARGRGYQDVTGRPIRFEGTIQDIDERKRAAEGQRRFLRDVLISVTEGRLLLCQSETELPASPPPFSEPIPLSMSGGLSDLRRTVSAACQAAGLSDERCYDLVTAASEAGMNAAVHVGKGIGQVFVDTQSDMVQVRVTDHGSGISLENLPHATLRKGFTTAGTLGHGMKMMLQTADRVFLLTGPGGTCVVIEQERVVQPSAWL
jgi:anti-sigma regulatory factor (Ser/Thr protein kinase)